MFVKSIALAASVLLVWSVVARPSGAHGPRTMYRVKAYDTLWTIAASRYSGDVRSGVWQIENANHLSGPGISPGQVLVLP